MNKNILVPIYGNSFSGNVVNNYCNPANQFHCNSCWAIASCQCVSDRLRNKGIIDKNDELNYYWFHDYICSNSEGNDSCTRGTELLRGLHEMVNTGAPLMSETRDRSFNEIVSLQDNNAPRFKVKGWKLLRGATDQITKKAILNELNTSGSVITTVNIYDSFLHYVGSSPYQPKNRESSDSMIHMVCIIGYDTYDQSFIIRNSYGNSYGWNGLVKIPYNDTKMDFDINVFAPIM